MLQLRPGLARPPRRVRPCPPMGDPGIAHQIVGIGGKPRHSVAGPHQHLGTPQSERAPGRPVVCLARLVNTSAGPFPPKPLPRLTPYQTGSLLGCRSRPTEPLLAHADHDPIRRCGLHQRCPRPNPERHVRPRLAAQRSHTTPETQQLIWEDGAFPPHLAPGRCSTIAAVL